MSKVIDPLNILNKIGKSLLDFEPIKNGAKNYTLLGKGNFAYVEKMKSKKDNHTYAIKKIDMNSPQFNEKDFKRETEIMFLLNQENIIKLYGHFEDKENLNKYKEIYKDKKNNNDLNKLKDDIKIKCLVLEFAENGSLRNFVKNKVKNRSRNLVPIEEKEIINIFKQLLSGLKHLHDKGVMHRDITPDNILLDEKNNVKISDFGISAIHKDNKTQNKKLDEQLFSTKTIVGRISFASPQIQSGEKYDYSCDIYSLGLTILYMMSYENPISVIKTPVGEKNRILKLENMHQSYNQYLKNLIERMVDDDTKLRPTASDAYDELEAIEIFKTKENNKIMKKSLDKVNAELERKKKEKKEKKENKNFKKMKTDMDFNYKGDINSENKTQNNSGNTPTKENEFISSNNIYSNSIKNSNQSQSNYPYNNIPRNPPNITYNQNNNPAISGKYPDNNFKRNSTPQISQVMTPPTKNETKPSKKINEMLKIFDKSK